MIQVSENNICHCTGTKKLRQRVMENSALRRLQKTRHKVCRRDMLVQTVPCMGSGNRLSLIAVR